jgi:hypothetical protein
MMIRRNIPLRFTTTLLMALLWSTIYAIAQKPGIEVQLDREAVFIGDTATLIVTLSGGRGIPKPTVPQIDGLDISLVADQPGHVVSIVNFKKIESFSRKLVYRVVPQREGTFQIGPVKANVQGRPLVHKGVSLKAHGEEEQDLVFLELSSTRKTVLVDEPFQINFTVLIKRISGYYQNHDPIHPERAPHLTLSFLDGMPDGLVQPDIGAILQKALVGNSNTSGFRVNDFTVRNDPFSMFSIDPLSRSRNATFRFPRQTVQRASGLFYAYVLKLEYRADNEGRYTFKAPAFKGDVIISADSGGRVQTRPIMARGTDLTIEVTPPPLEGRPKSFIGVIGSNLTARASLDTQTCNVGDPLTLTLEIDGDISLKNMEPPELDQQAELTRRFRVYTDSIQTESRATGKTYRYTIRPKEHGTYELPSINIAYFNAQKRKYHVVTTEPIPFRAQKVAEIASDWVLSESTNRASRLLVSNTGAATPAPMTIVTRGAVPDRIFDPSLHLGLAAIGPTCCLLSLLFLGSRRATKRLHFGGKRRNAARRAIGRLQSDAASDQSAPVPDVLADYLKTRLRLDQVPQTPAEISSVLTSQPHVDDDIGREFVQTFEKAFNAQFSQQIAPSDAPASIESAIEIITRFEKRLAKPRRGQARTIAVFILTMHTVVPASLAAGLSIEHQFMWDEANTALARARTPAEFLEASGRYETMLAAGVINGPVLYNLGTARLQAKQHAEALDALNRAERYAGTSRDIVRNMSIAASESLNDGDAALSWWRIPFFWHFALSGHIRFSIAAAAFSLCWLAFLFLRFGAVGVGRPLLALALLAFAVFGTSALITLYAEQTAAIPVAVQKVTPGAAAERAPQDVPVKETQP